MKISYFQTSSVLAKLREYYVKYYAFLRTFYAKLRTFYGSQIDTYFLRNFYVLFT